MVGKGQGRFLRCRKMKYVNLKRVCIFTVDHEELGGFGFGMIVYNILILGVHEASPGTKNRI